MDAAEDLSSHSRDKQETVEPYSHPDDNTHLAITEGLIKQEQNSSCSSIVGFGEKVEGPDARAITTTNEYGQETIKMGEPTNINTEIEEECRERTIEVEKSLDIKADIEDWLEGTITMEELVNTKTGDCDEGAKKMQGTVDIKTSRGCAGETVKIEENTDAWNGVSEESNVEVWENDSASSETDSKPQTDTDVSHGGIKLDICASSGYQESRINKISTETPHTCTVCLKSFTTKQTLIRHTLLHTGEKPYSCTVCGKSFIRKSSFIDHKLQHTGGNTYPCTICGKSFANKSNLTRHNSLHKGEKAYSCAFCGKSFGQKTSLTNHELLHTGEKPYSCTVCGKSFTQKNNLQRHNLLHTK